MKEAVKYLLDGAEILEESDDLPGLTRTKWGYSPLWQTKVQPKPPGPVRRFSKEEIRALQEFMKRTGRL